MNKSKIYLLPLFFVLLIGACRKEEEFCDDPADRNCPNFDVCTEAIPANSDFIIVSSVNGPADTIIDVEIDTSYGGSKSYYKAVVSEGLDSYAWRVGADPNVFTGNEVNINFSGFVGDIIVTLETAALDDMMCLSAGQLNDTKSKTINYASSGAVGSIFGRYIGSIENDEGGQEYEVVVDNSFPPYRRLRGLPLPSDCDYATVGIPLYRGYQFFVSTFTQEGPTPRCRNLTVVGRINLDDSNEIRIEYVYDDDDGNRKEVVFVGQRQ